MLYTINDFCQTRKLKKYFCYFSMQARQERRGCNSPVFYSVECIRLFVKGTAFNILVLAPHFPPSLLCFPSLHPPVICIAFSHRHLLMQLSSCSLFLRLTSLPARFLFHAVFISRNNSRAAHQLKNRQVHRIPQERRDVQNDSRQDSRALHRYLCSAHYH